MRVDSNSDVCVYVFARTCTLQTLCEATLTYAELVHKKLQEAGFYDNVGQFDVTNQATAAPCSFVVINIIS